MNERFAEEGDVKEKRPKLTHEMGKFGPVSLSHRLEYRTYESDLKSDYMRYRLIFGTKYKMFWAKVQPRWKVGGEGIDVDSKIDDIKTYFSISNYVSPKEIYEIKDQE